MIHEVESDGLKAGEVALRLRTSDPPPGCSQCHGHDSTSPRPQNLAYLPLFLSKLPFQYSNNNFRQYSVSKLQRPRLFLGFFANFSGGSVAARTRQGPGAIVGARPQSFELTSSPPLLTHLTMSSSPSPSLFASIEVNLTTRSNAIFERCPHKQLFLR